MGQHVGLGGGDGNVKAGGQERQQPPEMDLCTADLVRVTVEEDLALRPAPVQRRARAVVVTRLLSGVDHGAIINASSRAASDPHFLTRSIVLGEM